MYVDSIGDFVLIVISAARRLVMSRFTARTQSAICALILVFVIPYGFGGNPFGIDVFGSACSCLTRSLRRSSVPEDRVLS